MVRIISFPHLMLILELFHMNNLEEVNIEEMKRVLVFTSVNDNTI